MRLDKYLKVSRLIKRRTVANDACDGGRIAVNGLIVKASYQVKIGDVIALNMGSKTLTAKVLSVPEHVRKEEAADCYEIIENNNV